ncbi:MAG: TIGR00304 family protein [Candidatus Altiarchaeales archaeon]|nr:MAG: TIGR00304 family protein [Candidatus Altiarchaeales archaeon]RLI93577.1 MAG: TIGR00304 family protein [Candidatus Altiarchaeales archaeon]HDO82447.1 DUF131 domain-containing protein [Candidatus Altiarchaeales archaeon]HEX55096.1 DUF131 domain-containing protein [Candidatus Altiarchaeales archaeon]
MENFLIPIGVLIIILGFIILFVGFILQFYDQFKGTEKKTEIRGAGIIFIGPIPIAFGTDKGSLLIISAVMIILMLMMYFLFRTHGF